MQITHVTMWYMPGQSYEENGNGFQRASGFVLMSGHVVTAFEAIDGATSVRVVHPDGQSVDLKELAIWNRWQDWAVLPPGRAASRSPESQPPRAWQIGDRVFSLATTDTGIRSLVDTVVAGIHEGPESGRRPTLQMGMSGMSVGAAVIDEYGRLVGIGAGSTIPGDWSLDYLTTAQTASRNPSPAVMAAFVVPLYLVGEVPDGRSVPFDELRRSKQFTPALGGNRRHVSRGTLGQSSQRRPGWIAPVDEKSTFSKRDGPFEVIVNFLPKAKLKTTATVTVYTTDGRQLGEGKLLKLDLKPAEGQSVAWKVDPITVEPGVYRIDVLMGTEPIWRTFVRIVN